jgi:hypothetical protein
MGWRGLVGSSKGRLAAAAALFVAAAALGYASLRHSFGDSEAARVSQDRVFVCAKTGKAFSHRLSRSDTLPVYSPHSGEKTGYPAELCYWTADGQVRKEPVAVLLNTYLGKDGPTFCPDCGRLVVGHNPPPDGRRRPPPTRQEYRALAGGQRRRD